MKTLRTLFSWATALAITGILFQCKKSNDKKPSCQIITATFAPNVSNFHLTYNPEGKPIRIVSDILDMKYEYSAGSTTIVTFQSGNFQSKTIATLNKDGLATNIRTENDTLGTSWSNTIYEYNGQELSRSTLTTSTGGKPVVSTYTWDNHNLIVLLTDTVSQTLGYYTNRPRQTGDYLLLAQQIQGFEIYRSKNLIKTIAGTSLNYEFGADGRINSFTATTGANEIFVNYEYQCE
jgi:hypothetical protein